MTSCTVDGCAMCAGTSCAACDADDLADPCGHDAAQRHLGRTGPRPTEPPEARAPTKPLPQALLADRIDVNPADPESVAHFLETWAQIVRTRRCFSIIVQPGRPE
ncbi:MAG TPA: hypothetical protein VLE97_09110 [Gaiellaceae bacterium]|nr:hypothetical protein [Gaiellaceae bacterium]